jgi:leucyl aminopeptidase
MRTVMDRDYPVTKGAYMNIVLSTKSLEKTRWETLVVFAANDDNEVLKTAAACKPFLPPHELGEFSAKQGQVLVCYPPPTKSEKEIKATRMVFVGLGKIEAEGELVALLESYRLAGGEVAQLCRRSKTKELAVALPSKLVSDETLFAEGFVEGLLLGLYSFDRYRTKQEDPYQGLSKLSFVGARNEKKTRKAIKRAQVAAESACKARDMANEPGNGWTPSEFAKFGERLARKYDLSCTILDKKQMQKLGMGGILAVNSGSHEEPKLVCLEYAPKQAENTIMLVGKGLTFDSGGISIKPAQGMMDMKYDMCGGAAVITAMEAVAIEQPKVRVVGLVPSTDNMSGGGAVKPGDIITHYGGLTAEIENTDAEGRLILADALAYGIKQYQPDYIVDLATLTGAVIIALGHHHSGIMGNNQGLVEAVIEAGNKAGEPIWQLPIGEAYANQLKSKVADCKNTGGRPAGSITAAEYLHKFVGETAWVHLDIAGTAWEFTEKSYIPKGPSGIGTRTLIAFIREFNPRKIRGKKS